MACIYPPPQPGCNRQHQDVFFNIFWFGDPNLNLHLPQASILGTWRIIQVRKWLGSPPFISHEVRPFGRGPTTPGIGDLRSPWSLTTDESWHDPPSSGVGPLGCTNHWCETAGIRNQYQNFSKNGCVFCFVF